MRAGKLTGYAIPTSSSNAPLFVACVHCCWKFNSKSWKFNSPNWNSLNTFHGEFWHFVGRCILSDSINLFAVPSTRFMPASKYLSFSRQFFSANQSNPSNMNFKEHERLCLRMDNWGSFFIPGGTWKCIFIESLLVIRMLPRFWTFRSFANFLESFQRTNLDSTTFLQIPRWSLKPESNLEFLWILREGSSHVHKINSLLPCNHLIYPIPNMLMSAMICTEMQTS